MNGIELFERIKQVSTFSDLLSTFIGKTSGEMQSKRGNLFEKVCSIINQVRVFPTFPNDSYDHYYGNIKRERIEKGG
jgi:hypothetical protein